MGRNEHRFIYPGQQLKPAPTMTHTVIVGSGIIGISTAYYLSILTSKENSAEISGGDTQNTNREHNIHLVDPAPILFEHVASGKAGGFLARNWFSSPVAELGAFSFDLHKKLAEQFDGRKKWGWSQSAVINLDVTGRRKEGSDKGLGEGWDWIQSGESTVSAARSTENEDKELGEHPPWLNNFVGARPLADRKSTAQLWDLSRTSQSSHTDYLPLVTLCAYAISSSTNAVPVAQSEFTTLP